MSNRFLRGAGRLSLLGAILMAGLIAVTQVQASSTKLENAEPNNTPASEQELGLSLNNPGSIVERLEEDAEPKDYLFQFPGVSGALKPWYDLKADLEEKHGFRFGISYTTLYQKASDSFGSKDEAAGFDLDISGSWTFLGRGTDSPTMLGFSFFWRDTLGTELAPQALFTQFGGLYSTAAPYGETDPVHRRTLDTAEIQKCLWVSPGEDLSHYGVRLLSVQKLPDRLRRLQSRHQRSHTAARQRARRVRRVQTSLPSHAPPRRP